MIQDKMGSNQKASFFPENMLVSSKAKQGPKPSMNIDGDDSYEAVMKSALTEKKSSLSKPKLDKPKVGNRDPFFPEPAMPYHPEQKVVKSSNNEMNTSDLDESEALDSESEKLLKRIAAKKVNADDYEGLIKNMFESSSVSYPVSQIAKDSLDENIQAELMAQGLWNTQGFYLAKPSEQVSEKMMTVVPVQKPIAQFMASMENELGVSPDRLVQAYSDLTPGQLLKNPEETMGEVIKKLDLNSSEEKKATELYSKMLSQMQTLEEKEPVDVKISAFAMAPELKSDQLQKFNQKQEEPQIKIQPQQSENKMFVMQNQSQQQSFGEFSQEGLKQESGKKDDALPMPKGHELQSGHNTHNLSAHKSFDVLGSNQGMAIGEASFMGASAQKSEAKNEAIQSIINNTQALSQKGGGEMKLTLKPEHLGEIQLKVSMNGNMVDVKMVAEKSEAKKLLEQNIQELKHGLASHNLTMDKLDVSVSDKNTGTFHQNRNPNFDQAREFTQQFNQNGQASRNQRDEKPTLAQGRKIPGSILRASTENSAMKIPRKQGSSKLNVVA